MCAAIAFVLKGYPRLSETFIAQEIRGLEASGLDIRIVSLRHPTDRQRHPVHDEIDAPVLYLPEYLHDEPRRVTRAWRVMRRSRRYPRARRTWLADLRRDRTSNRIRRFGQAMVLAHELMPDVVHLHAHFMHTPGSVARYTSELTGLPWTCSAHARDIWTTPAWEKREKLAHCRWLVTCTAANRDHLIGLAPRPDRVELIYHGLDFERFPLGADHRRRDGTRCDDPVVILSVGRAVEKKGYDDLLDALARLPQSLHWRFEHVGSGPDLPALKARARERGMGERVHWWGSMSQQAVWQRYAQADLFALACRVASDGDRDGLPNVLVEAQSRGLACVTTRVSAIPELIVHDHNGYLAEERDVSGLVHWLERLIRDPALRARMGAAGLRTVGERFDFRNGIDRLVQRFEGELTQRRPGIEARVAAGAGY